VYNQRVKTGLAALLLVVLCAAAVRAHHSFAAEYDEAVGASHGG